MSNIHFDQVSHKFPGASHWAVNHCSLTVETGKLVVILGPSGCGKTTLLKMVNRLYELTSGKISLNGQDIRQIKPTTLRQQIGYVLQQSGLFPHMTVAQNIAVVPKLLGWSRTRTQERIDELMTLVQLPPEEFRDRYPAQISGGQQQRVGLARALAGDPQVMLMDEPFGAIDAITRASLQNEILRLQQQFQKTILFVSHDVEEALRLADCILIMRDGQVVQYDTPSTILTQPADEFVYNLMGADDRLRHLSLLKVETVMTKTVTQCQQNEGLKIAKHDSLRDALSLMLRTGSARLTVLDNSSPVGFLTLEQIRNSANLGEEA